MAQAAGRRVSGPPGATAVPLSSAGLADGLTELPASSGASVAPEPSGILPVMGEFLFGRGCLGTGVPIFSAWGAAALAPAQSWSPGTIWGARWRSSYHAAGSREALGGRGAPHVGLAGCATQAPGAGATGTAEGANRWHEGVPSRGARWEKPIPQSRAPPAAHYAPSTCGTGLLALGQKVLAKRDTVALRKEWPGTEAA